MPTPTATIFLPYHALDDVILRGPRAAQPAASAVVAGTLYGVTDEGNLVERSTGTVWQAYSPTGGGGGAPAAHHATHEPGGSDPLAVDAVAATGSLRTLGTGAQQAAPGNDARFAAGTAAHHASHEPGGADALVNAAWTNQPNVFTENQSLSRANPVVTFIDTSQPANQRRFDLVDALQTLYVSSVTDAAATVSSCSMTRAGDFVVGRDVYEKGRATALGHWTDVPYSAANFTSDTGSWTVPGHVTFAYTLLGKTLLLAFYAVNTTIGGAPVELRIALPGGVITARDVGQPFSLMQGGAAGTGWALAPITLSVLKLYRDVLGTPWTAGTTHVTGVFSLNIQ